MLLLRLARADLWHDRKVSLCIGAALVAVIAPMLLLFGLKYGVVSQMQEKLMRNPALLEIKMQGNGNYDAAWLASLQASPQVGFAVGKIRSLSNEADLQRDLRRFVKGAEIIPTGKGDPLMAGVDLTTLDDSRAVLTASAAQKLEASVGDTVRMLVTRRLDGREELGTIRLTVHAILPPAAFGRPAAFVLPAVLQDIEWFLDGFNVARLGLASATGRPVEEARLRYAGARLFAANVEAVEPLERSLNQANISTSSNLRQIEEAEQINRILGLIFSVVAGAAILGCMASLAGAFLANIDRKRRDLAVLRLLGFTGASVAAYILFQAVIITALAYVAALGLYAGGSAIFNAVLVSAQSTGEFVCRITWVHATWAALLALAVALIVSFLAAARAVRVEPAESLREI